MSYELHVLIMIGIYSILGLSLNLVVGLSGQLSLCQAAFYGIGAYSTALLVVEAKWGFLAAVPASVLITAAISVVIAIPSLRLKGDYFVLATLGFQVIAYSALYNWERVTRGPFGIPSIPAPELLGYRFDTPETFALLTFAVSGLVFVLISFLERSPFGRVLKAIREDELAAESLGKRVGSQKIMAFVLSAGFASIAGSLFAGHARFIDPTSFSVLESTFLLAIVVIGGAGNAVGPILGSVVLVSLPEFLRFLELPDRLSADLRQLLYGLLLVVIVRLRPQGLAGDYRLD